MTPSDPTLSLRAKMLGALLRQARSRSGKTLKETANFLGVSPSTVSSYEHGRKAVSLPELEVLAYLFDAPLRSFWEEDSQTRTGGMDFDPATLISLRQRVIGAQLRSDRMEAQYSIQDLAGRVGFPSSRISAYERGERAIPTPELEVLAAALGHRVDRYFDSEGPIGEWAMAREGYEVLLTLPEDLRRFVADAENLPYLQLAMELSQMDGDKLRAIGQAFFAVSP